MSSLNKDLLSKKLSFSPAKKNQESLILNWLKKPHVQEYFHGEGLANTIEGLNRFLNNHNPRFDAWIAYIDNDPFAFLITSTVEESEKDNQNSPYRKWIEDNAKMITLDLLIGEEKYLGKKIAPRMIKEFLKSKFSDVDIVFIDPEASNTKAVHVYEKAGFQKIDQYIAPWHPVLHWLMYLKTQ